MILIRHARRSLLFLSVLMVMVPAVAGAQPAKIDICHVDDQGSIRELSLPAQAAQRHLEHHGDFEPLTFFVDVDGDGFGSAALSAVACSPPAGYVDNPDDCDDSNAAVNPEASEVCNGVDDDCDGTVDGPSVCSEIGWANLQWPPSISHTLGSGPTVYIYGQIWIDGVTSQPGATPGLQAQVGFGVTNSVDNSWTWTAMAFNVDVGNNDEFVGSLLPTQTGTYCYTTRYSIDGGTNWFYAVNGPDEGNPSCPGPFGVLTVSPPS